MDERNETEEVMETTAMDVALQNDLVLANLFDYMGPKDLLSCRLISSKWEELSRQYFLKRSNIFIKCNFGEGSEKLKEFKELFRDASAMPFTKFYFNGTFPLNQFEEIIDTWPSIKELFLEELILEEDERSLANYVVSKWKELNLKTLSCVGKDSTSMIIPLSQISSIKNLYLDGSYGLDFDTQIFPNELSIKGGVIFVQKQKLIQNSIRLNEMINLKKVRKLTINQRHHTNVTVDVSDCPELESLSNHWGGLVGLSAQSKIKELSISTPYDISFLPVQIEKLQLGRDHVSCSSEVNLPNLKYLDTDNGRYLPKFLNCPNLTDLVIGEHYSHYQSVPIPLKVSRMFINVTRPFQFPGDRITKLSHLHLELDLQADNENRTMRKFIKALEFLQVVQTEVLIVSFKWMALETVAGGPSHQLSTVYQHLVAELIKIVKVQVERGGSIAFGGIQWDMDCAMLQDMVDRRASFYLFENGQGLGIEEEAFRALRLFK